MFLAQQGAYGIATVTNCGDYETAFNIYLHYHPSLKEMFPDLAYREQNLHLRVRAFARRLIKEQQEGNKAAPATPKLALVEPAPIEKGWGPSADPDALRPSA